MTYNAPKNSGGTDTVPAQSTTEVRFATTRLKPEYRLIHNNHHNIDAALKIMFIEAVNGTYIFALHIVFA